MISWPPSLVREIAARRCVFFLGAGVSASAVDPGNSANRPKTWTEFLKEAAALINVAKNKKIIEKLIKEKKATKEIVEELYLSAYARRPTKAEMEKIDAYVGKQTDRQQALEDVLWAILNSKEFMFNH